MTVTSYQVQGMTCEHCVSSVKAAVGALPGVTGVEVNLQAGSMTTTGTVTIQAVSQAVADAGYAIVSADQAVGGSLPMASRDANPQDKAGRVLYEERMRVLPGLFQPPAPDWEELDESTRERWRGYAEDSDPGRGPTAVARDKGDSGLPHRAQR